MPPVPEPPLKSPKIAIRAEEAEPTIPPLPGELAPGDVSEDGFVQVLLSVLCNILWLLLGGLLSALCVGIGGLICCLTIIGIPFGLQLFKIGSVCLSPFGTELCLDPKKSQGCFSVGFNALWLLCGGLFAALFNLVIGALLFCTVVGIPFALQFFKIAQLVLMPFGQTIRRKRRMLEVCIALIILPLLLLGGLTSGLLHLRERNFSLPGSWTAFTGKMLLKLPGAALTPKAAVIRFAAAAQKRDMAALRAAMDPEVIKSLGRNEQFTQYLQNEFFGKMGELRILGIKPGKRPGEETVKMFADWRPQAHSADVFLPYFLELRKSFGRWRILSIEKARGNDAVSFFSDFDRRPKPEKIFIPSR